MIGMNAKLWGAAALIALSVPLIAETAVEDAPGGPPAGDGEKEDRTERAGNLFSGSMRQYNCSTDLLVCVTSVTTGLDVDFDGLVKFCNCGFLYQRNRICGIILYTAVY